MSISLNICMSYVYTYCLGIFGSRGFLVPYRDVPLDISSTPIEVSNVRCVPCLNDPLDESSPIQVVSLTHFTHIFGSQCTFWGGGGAHSWSPISLPKWPMIFENVWCVTPKFPNGPDRIQSSAKGRYSPFIFYSDTNLWIEWHKVFKNLIFCYFKMRFSTLSYFIFKNTEAPSCTLHRVPVLTEKLYYIYTNFLEKHYGRGKIKFV